MPRRCATGHERRPARCAAARGPGGPG
jgi:hypothetical protein